MPQSHAPPPKAQHIQRSHYIRPLNRAKDSNERVCHGTSDQDRRSLHQHLSAMRQLPVHAHVVGDSLTQRRSFRIELLRPPSLRFGLDERRLARCGESRAEEEEHSADSAACE